MTCRWLPLLATALLPLATATAQPGAVRVVTRSSITVLAGEPFDAGVTPVATVTQYAVDSLARLRVLTGETAPRGEQLWANVHARQLVVSLQSRADEPLLEIALRPVPRFPRYQVTSLEAAARDLGEGPVLAGVPTRQVERTIRVGVTISVLGDTLDVEVEVTRRGAVAPSLARVDPYMLASIATRLGSGSITALVGAAADSAERLAPAAPGPLLAGTQTLRVRADGRRMEGTRPRARPVRFEAVDSVQVETVTRGDDVAALVRAPAYRTSLLALLRNETPGRGPPGGPKRKPGLREKGG